MTATIPGAACPHVTGRVACDGCWDRHLHDVATGGPWRGRDEAGAMVARIDAALPLVLADLPNRGYASPDQLREFFDDGWTAEEIDDWPIGERLLDAYLTALDAGGHAVADRMPDRFT